MRKTSAKTLSLALSLLLVISVLFSLPFGVWAETEAVPGDLNGDKLVDANDVTILEAVLSGDQEKADGVEYDISGNKMVDSDDLTVLQNLADSSKPALRDLLPNGTKDVLSLVDSVEGGALQSAIVRGSSTLALELNGTEAATVLFAEPQGWFSKTTLEMDTLWPSGTGGGTLEVSLLVANNDTGNAIALDTKTVTTTEDGWHRISVSLPGTGSANDQLIVKGFTIRPTTDVRVIVDNLTGLATEEEAVTRADLEKALVEIAWDWYFKGSAYQYDSTTLNSLTQHLNEPLSGYSGGKTRLDLFPVLENATSQTSVFSVCSGYAYDTYLAALGYPILGAKLNSVTMSHWRNASYYPADGVGQYDMTILRWHNKGKNVPFGSDDTKACTYKIVDGQPEYQNWHTADEVKAFFEDWENTLRPGDIIVSDNPGHAVMYIGNGQVMHVNGGKYFMEDGKVVQKDEDGETVYDDEGNKVYDPVSAGTDFLEENGAVTYESVEDYFLSYNGAENPTTWLDRRLDYTEDGKVLKDGSIEHNNLVVLRPLNLLTLKDDNDDPSDDKLNPDYVLQTGVLNYQMKHDKTNTVQTTGYGITETAATRMQYPGMNIERTASVAPYGTAVKGGTITYTVKITNNSANAEYVAFRKAGGDTNYEGEDYTGLWVVEHIPANTTLDTYTENGATLIGDTLRWEVTVPAGGYVELTYTVNVTGEIGEKIVNGGGWVNNIPSNTLTNIIGGNKLSDAHQTALAGIDPTTITVTDGTDLAEQIYTTVTGKALPLPDVQGIMDLFFSEYKYTKSGGYYLHSGDATVYMYALNAQAPNAKDQIYYDMLVHNYYGGLWCYTDEFNGERRINELREEYLEVGDILVYMDLTESNSGGKKSEARTVEGYTVLVYLGNSQFAAVEKDGTPAIREDVLAYTEAFSHDLFVCLRPSQAFEDLSNTTTTHTVIWKNHDGTELETDTNVAYGTVPTYDGATPAKKADLYTYTFAGWTPEVSAVSGDVTYTAVFSHSRNLTASMLTEEELKILANITPADVKAGISPDLTCQLANVAPWVYQQAGIYYDAYTPANGLESTYFTALRRLFDKDGLYWTRKTSESTNYSKAYDSMLVPNAYGGTQMNNKPEFDVNYLQVGDLFCAAFDKEQTGAGNTVYAVFLYQGNGKFLLLSADSAVYTCEEVLNRTYSRRGKFYNWSYYYVIRPERFGNATRDLTLRKLTDAEMYELENITDTTGLGGSNLDGAAPWIYQQAKITYSSTVGGLKTTYRTANQFFDGGTSSGYWKIKTPATGYATMLVPNAYGGRDMQDKPTFDINYLQVGDLFCGMYSYVNDNNEYRTYLYQGKGENGEGKFLLMNSTSADTFTLQQVLESTFTYEGVEYGWGCYYVIRPENYNSAKRDISLRALTDAERYALSQLTQASTSRWIHTVLPDIYKAVGINVDMTGDYRLSQLQTLYKLFEEVDDVHVPREAGDDTLMRYFQKMMVPCYGGSYFAEDTQLTLTEAVANKVLQIGDIVSGAYEDADYNNTGSNFTALYQGKDENGEDKFLVNYYKWNAEKNLQVVTHVSMTAAEIDALTFQYYYTLRPENLATVSDGDTFTVTWVNDDGTVLATEKNVPLYTLPSHDEPTKEPYNQFTYTFAGWTPVITPVNGDVTYTATYAETENFYTVTWVDADGSELETDENVEYGTVPTYDGRRPYNGDTNEKVGFAGWDKEITAVTCDVTYTAIYTPLRDMTSGDLTDAERAIISNLTLADYANATSRSFEKVLPWVYKEAGIDITSAYGYASRTSVQISNTLSGNSGLYKDYYTKIAVAGSYGKDVTGIGTDDLQIGDIFAAAYLWTDADNTTTNGNYMYYVAVYQGKDDQENDKFLVAYDNGWNSSNKRTGASGIMTFSEIEATMQTDAVWAYRYVLRPSQLATIPCTVTWTDENGTVVATEEVTYGTAYATAPTKTVNGYTYTFGDAEGTVVVTDVTHTATSYVRDLTAHMLTDQEMALLAGITTDDVTAANLDGDNLSNVTAWIYKQANIDASAEFGINIYAFAQKFFTLSGGFWKLNSTIEAPYTNMLVCSNYGGTQMKNAPTFNVDVLQVGDILCAVFDMEQTDASSSAYHVYLYQGNGNFLWVAKSGTEVISYTELLAKTYTNGENSYNWSYYFTVRPERYNTMRDIALKPLTEHEENALASLVPDNVKGLGSGHLYGFVPHLYKLAGVHLDLKSQTASGARGQLFEKPSGSSYYVPKPASTNEVTKHFQTMFTGIYGGSYFETSTKLSEADLKVGDVFVGQNNLNGTAKNWAGVYQGGGKFLMYYWAASGTIAPVTITELEAAGAYDFLFYFILRPNNLAN